MNDENLKWLRVSMTINGVPCYYVTSIPPILLGYPEYQLNMIRHLKRKILDEATRGMEPIVEIFDHPVGYTPGARIPAIVEGSEVEISATKEKM